MSFVAPNLSAIVGSSIAARLMGLAGGLTALSKMPAGNIQLLGNKSKTMQVNSIKEMDQINIYSFTHWLRFVIPQITGFGAARVHAGLINECELVQRTPPPLQPKARRLVSTKATLAARIDSFHESMSGKLN